MGYYSDYLNAHLDFEHMTNERKKQLKRISELRGGRDIIVYSSDLTHNVSNVSISIDYSDILAFQDLLTNLKGNEIDVILETPGGLAEVVEDLVKLLRDKYEKVGIIVPGYAKSAGTIFAMAGDEILMGSTSALGPIDAQIISNNKRFSADAFLEGLDKIKEEVEEQKKLNAAYIPILQNISPGEIEHCKNAQKLSQKLVTSWLNQYKFKYWDTHSSDGRPVSPEEKFKRAKEIAEELSKQTTWLTHARSIKIGDLEKIGLKITNYEDTPDLNEAIVRYYTVLRMSFETNIYKLFETINEQIYRFSIVTTEKDKGGKPNEIAEIKFKCPKCAKEYMIQANLKPNMQLKEGFKPFPVDNNVFKCENCGTESNLTKVRLEIEAKTGEKIKQ